MDEPSRPPNPTPRSLLLGLIGAPIASSAAPHMHQSAGAALGLRTHYQLIERVGAHRGDLRAMLEGVRLLGFAGVNVTFPYKEAVVTLLDALAPGIAALGAVNTVVVGRDQRLTGHNTDSTGFARALREVIGADLGGPVALVGAGGVGRAIGFALAGMTVPQLRVFDRDRAKAEALVAALGGGAVLAASVDKALDGAAGVINATPIGMLPDTGCPVPVAALKPAMWVADVVYTPLWTPLLLAARERGCRVMTGRELCVFQACDAFQLFTGLEPPVSVIGEAFDQIMRRRAGVREV
ncbi:MAG: shikimate dehydrogenase [Alphaproteobacteria bacterium]|nr:shikimate dehydrogenase [Alphaproteobacteria bacterium]MCW5743671.1 shikimate dehydrogenase [Alphaproteobacteria bacterium]